MFHHRYHVAVVVHCMYMEQYAHHHNFKLFRLGATGVLSAIWHCVFRPGRSQVANIVIVGTSMGQYCNANTCMGYMGMSTKNIRVLFCVAVEWRLASSSPGVITYMEYL